jgi:outer membrane protein assembly factor BamB
VELELRGGKVGVKVLASSALLAVLSSASAADWPQWMGPERDGVWREQGILDRFPTNGLVVRWRVPVNRGYCGPVVAGDRVFLLDRPKAATNSSLPSASASERVVCLEANLGSNVWEHSYACEYRIAYPSRPRATPVIASGRLYTLGAMGDLRCLDARDGKVIWERHFLKDFGLEKPPVWGYAAHPLLDGDRLICLVGGSNSAVVAFHKDTGKELWRALTAEEIGYAAPVIHTMGGRRQLLVWHPDAVAGLEPESGRVLWTPRRRRATAAPGHRGDAARVRGPSVCLHVLPWRALAQGHWRPARSERCLEPLQQESLEARRGPAHHYVRPPMEGGVSLRRLRHG